MAWVQLLGNQKKKGKTLYYQLVAIFLLFPDNRAAALLAVVE